MAALAAAMLPTCTQSCDALSSGQAVPHCRYTGVSGSSRKCIILPPTRVHRYSRHLEQRHRSNGSPPNSRNANRPSTTWLSPSTFIDASRIWSRSSVWCLDRGHSITENEQLRNLVQSHDLSGYQPAPDARQPRLPFARHASRAVIVAQLNEPGD